MKNSLVFLVVLNLSLSVGVVRHAWGASCGGQDHELPIVTHWRDSRVDDITGPGFSPGASDQFTRVSQTPLLGRYRAGKCYYAYSPELLPDTDQYLADVYSIKRIPNAKARKFAEDFCARTGVPMRFIRPDLQDRIKERLRSRSGTVQVINGLFARGSLITVILPPNWSKDTPEGTYPILANGFYDLNASVFSSNGRIAHELVAESGLGGRTGAIGVLWNGGGGFASRTQTAVARAQFDGIIDQVARVYGGDRHRVLMYGASRGGMTALMMASNPDPHNYTVRYVYAAVSGVKLGGHARLAGATFPALFGALDYTLGLRDAWRPGWRYPKCLGRESLRGLNAEQAHLKILVGYPDAELVDREHSAISDRFVAALKKAGTQLQFEFSSHDHIIPYAHEVEYLRKLRAAGVPVEASIFLRGGHSPPVSDEWFQEKVRSALLAEVTPGGPEYRVEAGKLRLYRVDRASRTVVPFDAPDGRFPFTLEVPFRTYAGMNAPLVAVGEPGTEFEFTLQKDGSAPRRLGGVIEASGSKVLWLGVATAQDAGTYHYAALRIRKPGASWKELDLRETPTAQRLPLTTEIVAELPNVDGLKMTKLTSNPDPVEGVDSVNWGVSEW